MAFQELVPATVTVEELKQRAAELPGIVDFLNNAVYMTNINSQCPNGQTALHKAIEQNLQEVVEFLVTNGADIKLQDGQGNNALRAACLQGMEKIMRFLLTVQNSNIPRLEIQALELIGCYFVDEAGNFDKAVDLWLEASKKRQMHGIPPPRNQRSKIFDDNQEVTSYWEIPGLRYTTKQRQTYRQSLLVRERILGPLHSMTTHYMLRRGEEYAGKDDYKEGIMLLAKAVKLRHEKHGQNGDLDSDCVDALRVSSSALWKRKRRGRINPLFPSVFPILKSACSEIQGIRNSTSQDGRQLTIVMCATLHIIRLLVEHSSEFIGREQETLLDAVTNLMDSGVRDKERRSLLDLAKKRSTSEVDGEFCSDFPCASVIQYLSKISEGPVRSSMVCTVQ